MFYGKVLGGLIIVTLMGVTYDTCLPDTTTSRQASFRTLLNGGTYEGGVSVSAQNGNAVSRSSYESPSFIISRLPSLPFPPVVYVWGRKGPCGGGGKEPVGQWLPSFFISFKAENLYVN